MKILYKNQCLNLISANKPNFCEGCYFAVWPNCYASLILARFCVVTNKIFKQEIKKTYFMKVKHIELTAVPMYGGNSCMTCCFLV